MDGLGAGGGWGWGGGTGADWRMKHIVIIGRMQQEWAAETADSKTCASGAKAG